ncbi:hypothetical protein GCM10009850_010270 [Nonomuraea monospora]|uniref:Uncharacterized protein n=1 Tax=Nonomuraea monospora TaxID=568818 RepID=A0ABN3C9F9_9ACTN
MASTPARDRPLLTGPLIGLLPTGWVRTGAEGADEGIEGETAAWPQRSQ